MTMNTEDVKTNSKAEAAQKLISSFLCGVALAVTYTGVRILCNKAADAING